MATRSAIGVMHGDKVKAVYCHWDGYLDHNGRILLERYDSSKANHLVALGDISSLRHNVEIPEGVEHSFDAPAEEITVFYGRDRGEGQYEATYFKDYEHFLVDGQEEEYDYILRNVNGKATWFVSDHGGDFQSLAVALIEEILENVEVLPL